MMLATIRNYAQTLANKYMDTPVVIKTRLPADKDDENPYGDDTSEYETVTTTVMGWFIERSSAFADTGGMSTAVIKPTLRLPVGTTIKTRDQVQFNGNWWTVIDASSDDTWPAMLKVDLVKEQ